LRYGFDLGLSEIWAVAHPENERSIRLCEKLGLRRLGLTRRWYHELSIMFWAGAAPGQEPSVKPDSEAPAD